MAALGTSREQLATLAAEGPAIVRLVAELDVDIEPLWAFAALSDRDGETVARPEQSGYAFLLESAEKVASSDPDGAFTPGDGDRHARYSFVGYDPAAVVTVDSTVDIEILDERYRELLHVDNQQTGDCLDQLREVLPDLPRRNFPQGGRQMLDGGLVGFLGYDAVYDLWLGEVGRSRPASPVPDAQFVLSTKTLAFDEEAGTLSLVFTPYVAGPEETDRLYEEIRAEAARVESTLRSARAPRTGVFRREGATAGRRETYEQAVRTAKQHVLDGDMYQGVVSRRRELEGTVDPIAFYEALRSINPSPYMYLLGHDALTIVGASPETLVSVRDRQVVANPIAGTCARGSSPVDDRRLAGEMLADDKERSEHTMLVDLARNDVRRVSEPGSVRVGEFMNVLKYSHVQHIESTVSGELTAEADAYDATRAAFPAGTLSGAPKIRAMEIIDDLERQPRGVYGGGVGYYSWTGDADFAIVIRTATIREAESAHAEHHITLQAGAGIVADSDPASEFDETEQKMSAVLAALRQIEVSPRQDDPEGPTE